MRSTSLLIGALILVSMLLSTQGRADFFTFQQWSSLPPTMKAAYVAGIFDATTSIVSGDEDVARAKHQRSCIAKSHMSSLQMANNIDNFARGRPDLQTGGVTRILAEYLYIACGPVPAAN